MSHEPFTHDAAQFVPEAAPSGIDVSDVEAKYADLFAEVIWDGLITADKRQQLRTAAEVFGLAAERARQIEESLLAAHEARHHIAVVEQEHDEPDDGPDEPKARTSIAPLVGVGTMAGPAPADPRVDALQARIDSLERDNARLVAEGERLRQDQERLEQIAGQLRHALEETTSDLDQAQARVAELEASRPQTEPSKPIRSRRAISTPPPVEKAPVVHVQPSRNDPSELHRLVRRSPRDADLLRALFRSLQRTDDVDRRWCIAHVLVYLGAANDQERATYAAHADPGLVKPRRAVNEDEWRELLFHPDEDILTGEILAEIAPAVLLGHLTAMRASLAPELVDPSLLVDPHKATQQAVRCLAWAAAALGTRLPPVYVCRDLAITADIVLNPKPSTRLGHKALAGRSTRELAFLAGQHLTWYRKEHLLGKPSASVRRLEDMFVAALMIGNPGLPMTPEIKQRVEPIAAIIRPLLGDGVGRLQRWFARFVEQGGRTNLVKWVAAVSRTAACTGMLLANDLSAAESMLRVEGEQELDAILDELIVYFTAGRCSLLRKRIGIAVGS